MKGQTFESFCNECHKSGRPCCRDYQSECKYKVVLKNLFFNVEIIESNEYYEAVENMCNKCGRSASCTAKSKIVKLIDERRKINE